MSRRTVLGYSPRYEDTSRILPTPNEVSIHPSTMLTALSNTDLIALGLFFSSWIVLEVVFEYTPLKKHTLSGLMAEQRRRWVSVLAERQLRMVDTQIVSGLQQGSAFFTSTAIIAIGGCFALIGSTDTVSQVYQDLPFDREFSRAAWEIKAFGLAFILAYTFFKFGWAYRLFNYCGILLGAVPEFDGENRELCQDAGKRLADMSIIAGRHFTAGMRGLFFALGYLGWFIGPGVLMVSTVFVVLVLLRRQFMSNARKVLVGNLQQ